MKKLLFALAFLAGCQGQSGGGGNQSGGSSGAGSGAPAAQSRPGGKITTLTGQRVTHELPRGIQTHEVIRIAGHGMPNPRGGRKGDLLVQVVLDTPQTLTAEQETLFKRLAEIDHSQRDAPPAKKSIFHKLKDWLTADEGA